MSSSEIKSTGPDDYGISKILPQLDQEKVLAVLQRLSECGVCDENDLDVITEEDLREDKLLNKVQARKLVSGWKNYQELLGFCFCLLISLKLLLHFIHHFVGAWKQPRSFFF